MAVEAPSQVTPDVQGPKTSIFSAPEIQIAPENGFTYDLQGRVYSEWRPNLLRTGEGSPARRVAVFEERIAAFKELTGRMTPDQLDVAGTEFEDVVRYGNYSKIAVVDSATSLGIEIGSFIEKKVMEKMQEKYPANYVYDLVRQGYPPLETMAILKSMYENGVPVSSLGQPTPITLDEWSYRIPRKPAFKDPSQDVVDTWQRLAYGIYLRGSDRIPNFYGEAQEFMDEFKGLSPEQINVLARKGRFITAYDEPENESDKKLIQVGGEAADVVIAWDGYASAVNDEQDTSVNEALDGVIKRYRKTKKLVGVGISEHKAMRLQREVEKRMAMGRPMPFMPAAAAAILLG